MTITTLDPAEVQRIADGLSVGMEQLLHRIAGSVIDVDGTEAHSARALERRGLAIYSRREHRAYLTTTGLAVLDELARVAEDGHAILAGAALALGVDLDAEAARSEVAGRAAEQAGQDPHHSRSHLIELASASPTGTGMHQGSYFVTCEWAQDSDISNYDGTTDFCPFCGTIVKMAVTPVDRLVAVLGAKRWTHPSTGQLRWYVDDWHSLVGLDVELYNTGNISHATLNGETISNTAARRMGALTGKVWIDDKGVPHCAYVSAHAASLIRRAIAEKLAALQ